MHARTGPARAAPGDDAGAPTDADVLAGINFYPNTGNEATDTVGVDGTVSGTRFKWATWETGKQVAMREQQAAAAAAAGGQQAAAGASSTE